MATRCTCGAGHETFGACVRAKGIRIGWSRSASGLDLSEEKAKERELALYKSARDQGIQPAGTHSNQTRLALEISDRTGRAFDASRTESLIDD